MNIFNREQAIEVAEAIMQIDNANVNVSKLIKQGVSGFYANEEGAESFLVTIWETVESQGKVASVRTRFNRLSKAIHKEIGQNEGQALKVENSKLVLAGNKKKDKAEDSEFLALAKALDSEVSDELKARMIKAMNEVVAAAQ